MYINGKRVIACGLTAALLVAAIGTENSVNAGQVYDSTNVGITYKVENYIKANANSDAIATLTAGAASLEAEEEVVTTEEKVVEEVVIADEIESTPTDAKVYTQFQDRAVATTEGKVNIRTEATTDSEVVGTLDRGGVCLVKEIGKEWTKVASGSCEGYISNEYLAYGDEAGEWCEANGIDKTATVTTTTLKVREGKDENSNCVTLIPEGEEYYVYGVSDGWVEVSVDDDLRGFVKSDYVDVKYATPRAISVEEQAEADRLAKEAADAAWLAYLASQEANQQADESSQVADNTQTEETPAQPSADTQTADAQTETADNTVAEAPAETPATEAPTTEATTQAPTTEAVTVAPAGQTGVDLANYALQFVGNPYVWGGTSLTKGADCSGFVLSVYAQFGYSLPHNAAMQSGYGTEVSMSNLQAGDLIFYSNGGGIGHVAIYTGNGMVVHASNRREGIKTSAYNYRTPVKAVRILGQ